MGGEGRLKQTSENSETQNLGGGGYLVLHKSSNELSLDLHKSGNELSLDLHINESLKWNSSLLDCFYIFQLKKLIV